MSDSQIKLIYKNKFKKIFCQNLHSVTEFNAHYLHSHVVTIQLIIN
jgi:hypothetical protein